jgi:signal peptidase I
MPEVPSSSQGPESEQERPEAIWRPIPPPAERPPSGPFDSPTPPRPSGAFEPAAGPSEPAPEPPWAAPRPAAALSPFDNLALTTTGVPHFAPPAAIPALPVWPAAGEAGAQARPSRGHGLRLVGRGLRELAETLVLALLIFLLVRSVVQNFQVEGLSMAPTLDDGWYLLVNKALYWEVNLETLDKFVPLIDPGDDPDRYLFRAPRRGDIIVFRAPDQPPGQPERDFIKRIIGLPGETVEVRDCTVFINGEALEEPYIQEKPAYSYPAEVVPPGHYFVLGDNRNNSSDSHSWGMLPKENIIGQAWLAYWPWDNFGLIDNTSVEPNGTAPAQGPAKDPVTCS